MAHQTQAFPSKDDPVSSEGNEHGPSKQHSHKDVDRKAAIKLNLKPVKGVPAADTEELTPTADSPGAKGESESAPVKHTPAVSVDTSVHSPYSPQTNTGT